MSNWHLSEFTVDGIKFSSMEQYMMCEKALRREVERTESVGKNCDAGGRGYQASEKGGFGFSEC